MCVVQAPLPDQDDALQLQQAALRHSVLEPSDQSQTSVGSTTSSKKHKPGNWAGQSHLSLAALPGSVWLTALSQSMTLTHLSLHKCTADCKKSCMAQMTSKHHCCKDCLSFQLQGSVS